MDEHTIKCDTETGRNREQVNNIKHIVPPKPQRKTRNVPNMVANFVTEKTSYGLGCTTTDRETVEINPFPIFKRNKTSNTKGSRNVPYSRWLM